MKRLGCFTVLMMLVVAAVAYNFWRVEQLRGEVGAIANKLHVQPGAKAPAKAAKGDLVTPLAETERHTRRAKELIKQHRTREAQAELDAALKSLKSANTVSSDIAGDAAQFLGKARTNAEQVFRKAWRDIADETRTQGRK